MSRALLQYSHECLSRRLFLLDISVEPIISRGHGACKGSRPNMILYSNPIFFGCFLQDCAVTFKSGSGGPSEAVIQLWVDLGPAANVATG